MTAKQFIENLVEAGFTRMHAEMELLDTIYTEVDFARDLLYPSIPIEEKGEYEGITF